MWTVCWLFQRFQPFLWVYTPTGLIINSSVILRPLFFNLVKALTLEKPMGSI